MVEGVHAASLCIRQAMTMMVVKVMRMWQVICPLLRQCSHPSAYSLRALLTLKGETSQAMGNLRQSSMMAAPVIRQRGQRGRQEAGRAGPVSQAMRILCLLQENGLSPGQLSPDNATLPASHSQAILIPSLQAPTCYNFPRCDDGSWRRCLTLDPRVHPWGP